MKSVKKLKKKKLKNQIQKVGYLMVNGYIRTFWEQEGYHWENISYGGRGEISIKYIGAIWKFTRVKSTSLIFCNHPLSHDPYCWFFFYIHYAAELKKKSTKSKRPSVKSLFEDESVEAPNQPVKGSFLSLLPPKLDASEQSCKSK